MPLSASLCLFILFNFVCITLCLCACVNGAKTKNVYHCHSTVLFLSFSLAFADAFVTPSSLSVPRSKMSGRHQHCLLSIYKYTNFLYLFASNNIYVLVCTYSDPYFIFCKLAFTHRFDLLRLLLLHFTFSHTVVCVIKYCNQITNNSTSKSCFFLSKKVVFD